MSEEELVRVMHGARLVLPPEWEDSSLYRFNAALPAAQVDPSVRQLQPNVLITRHEKHPGDAPDRFFELTNADTRRSNPSFAVVRAGQVSYLGQLAAWQDARFTDPRTQASVFQRQLIVPTWPRHLTLITLTGSQASVEKMSEQMHLTGLGTPAAPRAEVKAGEGVVSGRLRSKPDDER